MSIRTLTIAAMLLATLPSVETRSQGAAPSGTQASPASGSDTLLKRFLTGIPLNRLGEPEDLVGPAIFLASDAAAMVTGTTLGVDGGNLALNGGGSHQW